MDVLIVERDELFGTMLAEVLADYGIAATAMPDEQALTLPLDNAPLVVITGMNRGHSEDLTGLKFARAMRKKWPALGVVYLAALWPVRLHRCALAVRDRFLAKPVALTDMVWTVRDLMAVGISRQG